MASYDLQGRTVVIQTPQKLPNIAPKCNSASKDLNEEKFSKQFSRELKKKPQKNEVRFGRTMRTETPGIVYHKEGAVYDSFKPAEGVTFSEKGKNLKINTLTLSEKVGRLSKTAFYSTLSEVSLKIANNLPSLLSLSPTSNGENLRGRNLTDVSLHSVTPQMNSSIGFQSNVSQILVGNLSSPKFWEPKEIPRSFIPKIRRKRKSAEDIGPRNIKSDIDDFNMNILDRPSEIKNQKYPPIALAEKNKNDIFRQSLGMSLYNTLFLGLIKKFPRERLGKYSSLHKKKLAPPPIGHSLGHGVLLS